jgi:hypothetical protein
VGTGTARVDAGAKHVTGLCVQRGLGINDHPKAGLIIVTAIALTGSVIVLA